jgi:hypothetical protein
MHDDAYPEAASPPREPRIVMTLVVRDEEDILETNLRYHLNQGVDFVIAVDNGSRDGTLDILRRYEDSGLLYLIQDDSDEVKRMQGRWLTRAARLAATEFGADWVIHDDADEFWWPLQGTLKDVLGGIPSEYDAVISPRFNFVLQPGKGGSFVERIIVRETRSRFTPKLAHRAFADVVVNAGSHRVTREQRSPDPPVYALLPSDVLRDRLTRTQRSRPALVCAPRWPIRILHFPVRSREQLERKVALDVRPGGFMEDVAAVRTKEGTTLTVDELYSRLVADEELECGLREGSLVVDTGLRDFLRRCPNPLVAAHEGPNSRSRRPSRRVSEAEMRAELAANELDVMHAVVRKQEQVRRKQGPRETELLRELRDSQRERRAAEQREKALSRRLSALEASGWWRLRTFPARIGRRLRRG